MMTQRGYAKHAGVSHGYVTQLVAKGMPMDSPEAADAWRRKNIRAKSTTQHIEMPPTPEPTAIEQEGPYRPAEASQPVDTAAAATDSPQGAYERQRQIERAAYDLAVDALRGGRADAGRLVAIHAAAAKNLTSARDEVIAQAEKERRLVSGDWVRKVMQEHDGAVASLLKAMPKQLSGRIAPHDPEHAERELLRWVQEVALKTLHNTDPWKA
jgi:hypothetical protein